MKKLISEQLPNDGGYHIKWLVGEANGKLKQIGKQGKRATIVAKKTSLSLQFTFKDGNGRPQKNVGLGAIPVSAKGIQEAEKIAQVVTGQLVAKTFTWDWFNSYIGKNTSEQSKQLTCKEMVEQFKKHHFKQRQGAKTPEYLWYMRCKPIEDILGNSEKPLCLALIRQIIESKENNSDGRKHVTNGLVEFLRYFDISDYKSVVKEYKRNNKPTKKKRTVPSDGDIEHIYRTGFEPGLSAPKKWLYRYPQWKFLYSLLAVYGLRIHEAWNIANWDKAVVLRNGDWVTVDTNKNNKPPIPSKEGDLIVPAILDPNNEAYILCIKHDTKTGYRMAMPLSPESHDWVKEFDLLQPLNLPDIPNPLEKVGTTKHQCRCSKKTTQYFSNKPFGFSAHALRHAYNHRGHHQGYNPKVLADSLGHSVKMNGDNYLRNMSDDVKYQGIVAAMSKEQNKRSEIELLREENKTLKSKLEAARKENELLRTKLQLNETFKESKGKK